MASVRHWCLSRWAWRWRNACASAAPEAGVGLRWPNDVFAGPRKLAGILVEVLPRGMHVVGVGMNTNNTAADAPAELRDRVATLRDLTGRTHDPTTVLIDVLCRLEQEFALLAARRASGPAGRRRVFAARRAVDGRRPAGGSVWPMPRHRARRALLLETPLGVRPVYAGAVRGSDRVPTPLPYPGGADGVR